MKFIKITVAVLGMAVVLGLAGPITALAAATTPSLGAAATFGVLASTYTNTLAGTINGDLGYTTPPDTATTVNGTTYVANGTYTQAGLDQATALANLNSQTATYTFPIGAVVLDTNTTRGGTTGEYTPGVYVVNGAMSIDTPAGITLNGEGTYIFRSSGALNTAANSKITLSNGASACDVFWVPTATTLGANSTFIGTDIDNAAITVGSTVTWTGRALAFGKTVTTNNDTITVPTTCAAEAAAIVAEEAEAAAAIVAEEAEAAAAAATTAATAAATTAATAAAAATVVKMPNTGIAPSQNSIPWNIVILSSIFAVSTLFVVARRKKII